MKHFKCRKCESSRKQFFSRETGSIVAMSPSVRISENFGHALWRLWKMSAHSSLFFRDIEAPVLALICSKLSGHDVRFRFVRSDAERGRPRFISGHFSSAFCLEHHHEEGRVKTQSRGYVKVDEGPFIFLCCGQKGGALRS